MEAHLRQKSQTLLKQLQQSQQLLNNELDLHALPRESVPRSINLSGNENSFILKPAHARNKLVGAAKHTPDDPLMVKVRDASRRDTVKNKENIYGSNGVLSDNTKNYSKSFLPLHSIESDSRLRDAESENNKKDQNVVDGKDDLISSSWQPATPNTQRKRNMIDRHIIVPTQLNAKDLRDLNKERLLNFSYSHVDTDEEVSDVIDGRDSQSGQNLRKVFESGLESEQRPSNVRATGQTEEYHEEKADVPIKKDKADARVDLESFKKQLEDDGNNRKLNSFIRDTTIKPKSLLNSTSYSLHNLSTSKRNASSVRFDVSGETQESLPDQRLLGYDWIAALLDNDSALIDQSESFFNELREFRKSYKDECSNRFYMEGPHTLVDFEPQPVVEALKEPKVEPYVVNERLFPEPVHCGLIDYEDDSNRKKREPTDDNPRFVRVSIPRSTLQSPQRWKPHRRRSFDSGDSCSLKDHCLLGWENRVPTVIPTAKYVDLKTAAGTGKDYQKITLAEAERQASAHGYSHWPFERSAPRLDLLHLWKQHYSNAASSMAQPVSYSGSSSSTNRSTSGTESIKRATDRLLSSTYATMYEMERLKEERRLENLMRKQQKKKL